MAVVHPSTPSAGARRNIRAGKHSHIPRKVGTASRPLILPEEAGTPGGPSVPHADGAQAPWDDAGTRWAAGVRDGRNSEPATPPAGQHPTGGAAQ
ncbi:hypothetical protein GCM10018773_47700 [Streptomyces candidus]|nr:hypothetical protein GCM10018773_47700 [Streptomyces candidus]